jgi:hypothetical protein
VVEYTRCTTSMVLPDHRTTPRITRVVKSLDVPTGSPVVVLESREPKSSILVMVQSKEPRGSKEVIKKAEKEGTL